MKRITKTIKPRLLTFFIFVLIIIFNLFLAYGLVQFVTSAVWFFGPKGEQVRAICLMLSAYILFFRHFYSTEEPVPVCTVPGCTLNIAEEDLMPWWLKDVLFVLFLGFLIMVGPTFLKFSWDKQLQTLLYFSSVGWWMYGTGKLSVRIITSLQEYSLNRARRKCPGFDCPHRKNKEL